MIGRVNRHWWAKTSAVVGVIVALGAVGCSNDAGQDTEQQSLARSELPKCQDVWVQGKTLPKDYEGCVGEDGNQAMPGVSYCADGSRFTTHEGRFFARLGGSIGAGPDGSPANKAAYSRFWSDCNSDPSERPSTPKPPSAQQDFETFAGDVFTVTLIDTKADAAQVRFCATAPYQGGSIPVTRSPWSMQDQNGTVWPAHEGDAELPGSAYPVEADVGVGDCLQGWIRFGLPGSATPVRVAYDSDIGGPFSWDVNSAANSVPNPPPSEPAQPHAPTQPDRDRKCFTLESAASGFSGNWLTLATRGQFPEETITLQDRLNWLGYGCIPEDGDYGPVTREAVKRFQRDFGLVVDGKVGPQTWDALFASH